MRTLNIHYYLHGETYFTAYGQTIVPPVGSTVRYKDSIDKPADSPFEFYKVDDVIYHMNRYLDEPDDTNSEIITITDVSVYLVHR